MALWKKLTLIAAATGWMGLWGTATGWAADLAQAKSRNAPARLVPSVNAVAPGASFEVAIAYTLADGWHIYWKNPGQSGAPPQVKWQLPSGFEVGELRFPNPSRHETGPDDFKVVTYVHKGKPVLLATVTAPLDLTPGDEVTIGAKVTTLACKQSCIPETQNLSFQLPVVENASAVKPAETELFERAAHQIPAADGRGKFVTVTAAPSTESVGIGSAFEVAVTVAIKPGHHIQSHRPYVPGLIPTEVIPERTPGLSLGKPVYPAPREEIDPKLKMKLSEFHGQPVIRIPMEVNEDAAGTSLRLAGVVTAQASADQTSRGYPPETVAWSTTVGLVGAPAEAIPVESAATDTSQEEALVATTDTGEARGQPASPVGKQADEPGPGQGTAEDTLPVPLVLLFSFLGGIILNVMPCVWPVISIKILSFAQQAHDDPRRTLRLGLLFGLGIVVSFWILGLVAVAGKAAVGGATWGTQFAHPKFVIAMAAIIYVFGLSLFGVFEINLPGAATGKLGAATAREGYAGSFVKGMLATVLATPCTAPFLGTAVAVAFSQSATVIMLAMTAIGVGMSLPYMLLSARPAWLHFLPQPGPWMESLKQFTGFLLMGVAIWLLYVLGDLTGASGVVATVTFLAVLGLACWVYGRIKLTWSMTARLVGSLATVAIALLGAWFAYGYMYAQPEGGLRWTDQRPGLHKELAAQGHTVFVNYTATWCTKCQIEKRTVLETEAVRETMRELGVVPIKGDWTTKQGWMSEELKAYGRVGVPANVILPAGKPDDPIVLPLLLTKGTLIAELERAGPSNPDAIAAADPVSSAVAP